MFAFCMTLKNSNLHKKKQQKKQTPPRSKQTLTKRLKETEHSVTI